VSGLYPLITQLEKKKNQKEGRNTIISVARRAESEFVRQGGQKKGQRPNVHEMGKNSRDITSGRHGRGSKVRPNIRYINVKYNLNLQKRGGEKSVETSSNRVTSRDKNQHLQREEPLH